MNAEPGGGQGRIEVAVLGATGVVGQRLVRTLCGHCREPYRPASEMVAEMGLERVAGEGPATLYRAKGCPQCNGAGYLGRTSIHELLVLTDRVRGLVLQRADAVEIERAAIEGRMRTMYDDGLLKALNGITTVEEVARVTQEY